MARRSAPSSNMWVPKAWRRVWGWVSAESPLATARDFDDAADAAGGEAGVAANAGVEQERGAGFFCLG